ncbi:MAG: hypothetical protein KF892_21965 [Rhizobacter sp.]|nr:hypothetical protein [Rhizobacter sp.]
MTNISRTRRDAVLKLVLPLSGLAVSAAALGQTTAPEESPYYIGATVGISHDSNVHRRPTGETADTIWTGGVIGGFNLRFGRQRVFADADAEVHRYNKVSGLDNKSYAVRGGLDWETIETLSGSLRYDARNNLNNFTAADGSTFLSDQQTQQFSANARYGLPSQVVFDLGYDHRTLEIASAGARNYSQDMVSAGLRWAVGGRLTLGAGVRATRGEQETQPVVDETKRRDIDLTATWVTGGFSTFNARVSATKETHSVGVNPDLSETTGALSWSYRPTGRLSFTASATRDTGKETTFSTTAGGEGGGALPVDNTRVGTTFAVDSQYELTGKISLNGNLRQRKGTLSNSQSEAVKGYGLGFTYLPARSLALRCSASRENRTVAGATAYEVTITGCTGEITLR